MLGMSRLRLIHLIHLAGPCKSSLHKVPSSDLLSAPPRTKSAQAFRQSSLGHREHADRRVYLCIYIYVGGQHAKIEVHTNNAYASNSCFLNT